MSANESSGVLALLELALDAPAVFAPVEARGWPGDGLTAAETRALWTLWVMSGKSYEAADEAATLRILEMPFLDEVSGADAAALDAFDRALSASRSTASSRIPCSPPASPMRTPCAWPRWIRWWTSAPSLSM